MDELLVRQASQGKTRLSVVIAVFIGWRVSILNFECGGRTYSVGPGCAVVAGDSARSRFELRVCNTSLATMQIASSSAIGMPTTAST